MTGCPANPRDGTHRFDAETGHCWWCDVRCSCGNPKTTRVMGARVTHTPERCGFTTGPAEALRVDVPEGISKDDMLRHLAMPKRRGGKS